jgi:opacity protein-like surface antigen
MKRVENISQTIPFITLIALTAIIVFASPAAAEEENFRAKNGFYIGVGAAYNSLEGDFDGETILIGCCDIILVPKVDNGAGYKIVLGGRMSSSAAEISYIQSDHDVTFLGAKGEAELKMFNFDWKPFFLSSQRLQPFILLGVNFTEFILKDGSSDGFSVGDAKFNGIGLNLGGGIAYYFTSRIALNAGLTYRWISFGSAEGVGPNESLADSLISNGVNLDTGLTFTF